MTLALPFYPQLSKNVRTREQFLTEFPVSSYINPVKTKPQTVVHYLKSVLYLVFHIKETQQQQQPNRFLPQLQLMFLKLAGKNQGAYRSCILLNLLIKMGKQERAQQKLNQQNNTDSLIQIPNICLFFSVYLSSPTKNPKPNDLLRATTFSLRILPLFYPQTITTPRQSP